VRDREAQANLLVALASTQALKRLKQGRQLIGCDARSVVADRDDQLRQGLRIGLLGRPVFSSRRRHTIS